MYSPKINEDLIPRIYKLAKAKKVKITTLMNDNMKKLCISGSRDF